MTSHRRKRASRANGAKSCGPKTPEGKERVRYNALRHGYLSHIIVLPNENRANFDELLNQHVRRFGPLDDVEFGEVEEMAATFWRQRRLWYTENKMWEDALSWQPENPDPGVRTMNAFRHLASQPEFALLMRYDTRLHNQHRHALHNLLVLQDRRNLIDDDPNDDLPEPEPIPQPSAEPPMPPIDCGESPAPSGGVEIQQNSVLPNEPSPISGQHPTQVPPPAHTVVEPVVESQSPRLPVAQSRN